MKAEIALVSSYLAAAYPDLRAALLTGSIVRGTSTATSDLDVVVLLPAGAGAVRETVEWSGRTVDVFGYDLASLEHWLAVDTSQRRPGLSSMVLDGVLIAGSADVVSEARAVAQRVYDAGPEPWTEAQLLRLRYGVTDVLLDVETAGDRAESLLLGSKLVTEAVTLLFATAGRWSGNGKWLLRELRSYDAELAAELESAYDEHARTGQPAALVRVADRILSRCGGRFLVGRSERS